MIYTSYAEQCEPLCGVRLVSCGHIFAKYGREILRPSGRADWLLFFVAKGCETFYFDHPMKARAGSFVLFAPGERQHHAYLEEGTGEFYYVHFSCEALPEGLSLETSRIYETKALGAFQLFEQIIDDTLTKPPHYEPLCLSRLFVLLATLQKESAHTEARAGLEHKRIARAIQFIGKSYDKNLSLEEYAALCNMSKFHFLRTFKQVTGQTPFDYRTNIRIENAKVMLEEGTLSVAEIGEITGFSSPAYFSDIFKKRVGVSPAKYRKCK